MRIDSWWAAAVGLVAVAAVITGCGPASQRSYLATNTSRDASPTPSRAAEERSAQECDDALPKVERAGRNQTARDVAAIQALVGAEIDGAYGVETTAKVMRWQQCNGLEADGVWGPASDKVAFAEMDAKAAEAAKVERDAEQEARRWHCRDVTSFDKNAYNDNLCENAYESRLVSDSEAEQLDPTYVPGKSGHRWYNDQ